MIFVAHSLTIMAGHVKGSMMFTGMYSTDRTNEYWFLFTSFKNTDLPLHTSLLSFLETSPSKAH